MALKKKLEVGKEVESYCTKCRTTTGEDGKKERMVRTHVIVAMKGDEPIKVRCLKCDSEHKYAPVKEAKPKAASKAKDPSAPSAPRTKSQKAIEEKAAATHTEWRNAVESVDTEQFKPYILNGVYQVHDLLLHPSFGKGQVRAVEPGGKMEVLFEGGFKRLVFNRKS